MNVIVCLGERLTSYTFNGVISREWVLNSHVKYMKMLPGPGLEIPPFYHKIIKKWRIL